jgi:diadenosine tetraphosphate (Ap4A) HIT family hydrolase
VKREGLDYAEDCVLFKSEQLIALTNAKQGRCHFIIRCGRNAPPAFPNDLEDFPPDVKHLFWHLVQQLVAECRFGCVLCHHYGDWRSAPHFHVHVIAQKQDFAKYTEAKVGRSITTEQILKAINQTEVVLVKRHLEKFKRNELMELRNIVPVLNESNFAELELDGFRIELDPTYPWVKFIPKIPFVYSQDRHEVLTELETNRRNAFSTMHKFAMTHKLTGVCLFF